MTLALTDNTCKLDKPSLLFCANGFYLKDIFPLVLSLSKSFANISRKSVQKPLIIFKLCSFNSSFVANTCKAFSFPTQIYRFRICKMCSPNSWFKVLVRSELKLFAKARSSL